MTLINVIRLAVAVASLASVASSPTTGQATSPPRLSTQQLNPPALKVNKPIAAPNKPITVLVAPKVSSPNANKPTTVLKTYSPNLNKPIAVPKVPTIAFQRPNRDMTPRDMAPSTYDTSNLPNFGSGPFPGTQPGLGLPPSQLPPCPGGTPRSPMGYC